MSIFDSTFSEGHIVHHPNNPGLRMRRVFYPMSDAVEMGRLLKRARAFSEAVRANANKNAGVQKFFDYQTDDGKLRIDWEEINGVSLFEAYCKQNEHMSIEEIRDFLQQIVGSLIGMHERGLAHLDIRPGTILQVEQKDREDQNTETRKPEYRLIGWHFAKPSSETYDSYLCLAPEIFDTSRGCPGTATDVYALAAALYILYTGQSPYGGTEMSLTQIRRQHLEETPRLRGLPEPLRPVFLQALSKDPKDRPTIREFHWEFEYAYKRLFVPPAADTGPLGIMRQLSQNRVTRRTALGIVGVIGLLLTADELAQWLWSSPAPTFSSGQPIGDWILPPFVKHHSTVNVARPSPDSSMVLSADASGRLMVWTSDTGKVLLNDDQQHAKKSISDVAWSGGYQAFASIDSSGLVWLWRLQDGTFKPFASQRFPTPARAIAWSSIGDRLLVASGDCVEIYTGVLRNKFETPPAEYAGHNDTVNSVAISRHGKFAVSGSNDNTAQMWVVKTARQICNYSEHEDDVLTVAISPDERYVASGGKDQSVQVWEALGDIGDIHFARPHNGTVRSVAWSLASQYIASGGDDKVVRVWNMNGELLYTYNKHKSAITSVAWLGNSVVSASSNEVHIWRGV